MICLASMLLRLQTDIDGEDVKKGEALHGFRLFLLDW